MRQCVRALNGLAVDVKAELVNYKILEAIF